MVKVDFEGEAYCTHHSPAAALSFAFLSFPGVFEEERKPTTFPTESGVGGGIPGSSKPGSQDLLPNASGNPEAQTTKPECSTPRHWALIHPALFKKPQKDEGLPNTSLRSLKDSASAP